MSLQSESVAVGPKVKIYRLFFPMGTRMPFMNGIEREKNIQYTQGKGYYDQFGWSYVLLTGEGF